MHDIIFEVFARKARGDALRHIGYLDAPDAPLARVYAWNTYDEENWFEMCVVPRTAIIAVNRTDGPFARGTGEGVPAGARLEPAAAGTTPTTGTAPATGTTPTARGVR